MLPGIALVLLGTLFEATADFQLARFKSNPEHRGCDDERSVALHPTSQLLW